MSTVRRTTPSSASPTHRRKRQLPHQNRAKADVNAVLAVAGSVHLARSTNADVRMVGRHLRARLHTGLLRDRGPRCHDPREATEGAYSQLPAWTHRDQWLFLVEMVVSVWFPLVRGKVAANTLLKFAARVAAEAKDDNGRDARRVYIELAIDMGCSEETVRLCWRALERMGLAVQVEESKYFSRERRLAIWREHRSKQRGHTPEYALVVPKAFAQALVTGEHPADLLAEDSFGDVDAFLAAGATKRSMTPHQRLRTALSRLRNAAPIQLLEPAQTASRQPVMEAQAPTAGPVAQVDERPVDKSGEVVHRSPFAGLKNVDILALPLGPRSRTCSAGLPQVAVVPHGVKSTASRAHNRGCRCVGSAGEGSTATTCSGKHQKRAEGYYGAHRDIAVALCRRVLWMKGTKPGMFQGQFKRFTVKGLPRVWSPNDFVTAIDAIYRRTGRYSPSTNFASMAKEDRGRAARAEAGAVRTPMSLLKWHLDQLDPVNDHPRFVLDEVNDQMVRRQEARKAAIEAHDRHLAEIGLEPGSPRRAEIRAQARELAGLPPVTRPKNRRR